MESKKCVKGYEVKVMCSPAGYYWGTRTEEGEPNCRCSGYAKTREDCEKYMQAGSRICQENMYCSEQAGCFGEWDFLV